MYNLPNTKLLYNSRFVHNLICLCFKKSVRQLIHITSGVNVKYERKKIWKNVYLSVECKIISVRIYLSQKVAYIQKISENTTYIRDYSYLLDKYIFILSF